MDLAKFTERTFGGWGWSKLFLALACALIAFVAVSSVITKPFEQIAQSEAARAGKVTSGVVHRWRDRADSREFSGFERREPKSTYGIAWLFGSEATIKEAPEHWRFHGKTEYFLTDVLSEYVVSVNDQPITVHEYRRSGVRAGDLRRAILHATSSPEIDAIIMPISPLWVFNEFVPFVPSNHRGDLLLYQHLEQVDFETAITVLRASEVLGSVLKSYLPIFQHRYAINRKYYRSSAPPYFAHGEKKYDSGSMVALWEALRFPHQITSNTPESLRKWADMRGALMMATLSRDSFGARILEADLRTLADSGKRAVLYIQPLHSDLAKDAEAIRQLQRVVALVNEIAKSIDSPNIKVVTETAFAARQPYAHSDLVHMSYGQGVLETLVDSLEEAAGVRFERRAPTELYDGLLTRRATP